MRIQCPIGANSSGHNGCETFSFCSRYLCPTLLWQHLETLPHFDQTTRGAYPVTRLFSTENGCCHTESHCYDHNYKLYYIKASKQIGLYWSLVAYMPTYMAGTEKNG